MTSYYLQTKVLLSDLFMYDMNHVLKCFGDSRESLLTRNINLLCIQASTCQKYAASTWTASQLVFTKDMSFPSASLPHDLHSERGYAFTKVRMTRVFGLLTARLIFRNSGNVLR